MRLIAFKRALMRSGARFGASIGIAGLLLIGVNDALQTASAEGDTRTLSFHHAHTDETITVTFKRDGRYDQTALKKLDWFMRDWRRNESVRMDPQLFDLLWEAYREVGGKRPIEVICGYRAPGTNAMLRARSSGVAQNSNHVEGLAIDFAIPGVELEKLREVGLRLQRGGVGFYPTSGSPFVHLDTGSVRHWPRMTHDQLAKVFPDGRTVHIPSDGQPLPGYALALADVEARGNAPSNVSLAAARDAGVDTTAATGKPGLLARIFGGGKALQSDVEPDETPAPARARTQVGSTISKPVTVERVVPLPSARPKAVAVAMATPQPAANSIATPNMFENRGIWVSAVESGALPPALPSSPFDDADPSPTASTGKAALAYAAEPAASARVPLPRPAKARPMGSTIPQLPATASLLAPTAQAVATMMSTELTSGGQRSDSPWLRAAILTPSISGFMTASRMGEQNLTPLVSLMHKPDQSLVMTFSADPHLGMVADRFTGRAVEFLATATFTTQTTASLR